MSDGIIFTAVIPASKKDSESQNLKDLIASIKAQDFPQDKIEILVITEGDSEQAKAIGIRRARGEICAMFCADNELIYSNQIFKKVADYFFFMPMISGFYTKHYAYIKDDNSLNRYFSLLGANDIIAYYLNKSDRKPWENYGEGEEFTVLNFKDREWLTPSLGDNFFCFRRKDLLNADLSHYYPMDVCMDMIFKGYSWFLRWRWSPIWHKTSDNLITFLIKRYKYARDLYCKRDDRRWKMLDTREDYLRLGFFILATLTVIQPLMVSIRGFLKVRDFAWFWHWPVCVGFLITYGALTFRTFFVRLLFQRWADLNPFRPLRKA